MARQHRARCASRLALKQANSGKLPRTIPPRISHLRTTLPRLPLFLPPRAPALSCLAHAATRIPYAVPRCCWYAHTSRSRTLLAARLLRHRAPRTLRIAYCCAAPHATSAASASGIGGKRHRRKHRQRQQRRSSAAAAASAWRRSSLSNNGINSALDACGIAYNKIASAKNSKTTSSALSVCGNAPWRRYPRWHSAAARGSAAQRSSKLMASGGGGKISASRAALPLQAINAPLASLRTAAFIAPYNHTATPWPHSLPATSAGNTF